MRRLLAALVVLPGIAGAQELHGHLGSREALMMLHTVRQADGGSRVTGEYVVFPTLQRRFLEGERGPELGVTTLKEGTSAIMFGHDPTGELRGTWRGGVFKGVRYGPGGQERERFEFSEEFPSMAGYSAAVRCELRDGRYSGSLAFTAQSGRIEAFDWRARVEPSGHSCQLEQLAQQPFQGGLRLTSGDCRVTLREIAGMVKVTAEGCGEHCGSQAYLEPVLVERRGSCRLLRPEVR